MGAATETVFSLQELCDQIVQHFALSSSQDLNSAALVCRTLCASAQAQIFRHVILDPYQAPDLLRPRMSPHSRLSSAFDTAASSFRRLRTVLTASPHLVRHIRCLSLLARSEILKVIAETMEFPSLSAICLNLCDTRFPNDDALHGIQHWIGLPSIRDVVLFRLYGDLTVENFASLFETSSHQLHSLAFIDVIVTDSDLPTRALRPTDRRTQIKNLKLRSSNVENWLTSPSCAFDFTELVEVETDAGKNPALLQILTSVSMSITRLRISGALALLVNLSEFPALTCLELHCSHIHAISSLAPDNRVERLVLHIAAYAVGGHTTSDWFSPADSLIADCTMPALRQVELQIGNTYGQALPFDLESLKLQFPQLKARGLFAVSEHRLSFPYI